MVTALLRYQHCFLQKNKQVTDDLESQVKQNKKMLESQQAMEKDMGLKRIELSRLSTDNGVLQKKVSLTVFKWLINRCSKASIFVGLAG